MKKCILFALLFIFLASCSGGAEGPHVYKKALRVRDGKIVPFGVMIDELQRADIVFVGESHYIAGDHRAELDVIRALYEKGVRPAIGLEMFRAESQNILDGWTSGTLDQHTFIRAYYDNWRIPWPFYRDIFLYAREKRIPIVGLNVPDEIAQKVAAKGFNSLSNEELAKLPPAISCDVDPSYMDFIESAYEAHGMKKQGFVFFCEAQMLWDKAMAWHLINYMKKNPGRKMVVLSGVGHSWKRGLPEQVRRSADYSFNVVLPEAPERTTKMAVTTGDADYVLLR
ncbi:MAG: ChaN family lipoprotein [Thermodesulfovibrionales bacterium]